MRRALVVLAALCVVTGFATADPATAPGSGSARGRTLYQESCSSCHGLDLRGIPGRAPKLRGVGAMAADFYLSTGRMPLARPDEAPVRRKPAFSRGDIRALVGYIGGFGGPPIPAPHPERGNLAAGFHVFAERCAGCHQIAGEGGLTTGARVPRLKSATPVQVAEAIRVGPYLMPPFSRKQVPDSEVASIARYLEYAKHPDDRGGWAIGHLGPVPEGMVAWFLGALALVLVARLLGERTSP